MKRPFLTVVALTVLPAALFAQTAGKNAPNSASQPDRVPKEAVAHAKETYVGVFTQPLSTAMSAQLSGSLAKGQGLLVTHVLRQSPAAESGIRRFDVLAAYDGKKIMSLAQFKKLLREGKPGSKITFEIIRRAKRQTIEVALGERLAVPPGTLLLGSLPGRPVPLFLHAVPPARVEGAASQPNASGARIAADSKAKDARKSVAAVGSRTVTVTTADSKRFRVSLQFTGTDGKTQKRQFDGTVEEIHRQSKELPAVVRAEIEQSLQQAGSRTTENRGFRFQLQPRLQGNNRSVHVTISRPIKGGGVRLFELDHTFGSTEAAGIDGLLKLDVLQDELEQLSPAIKRNVEQALRRARVPQARVQVQKSQ